MLFLANFSSSLNPNSLGVILTVVPNIWLLTEFQNSVPSRANSSYVPLSTTWPFIMNAISSAVFKVDKRCAIRIVVRLCEEVMFFTASFTSVSLAASSADVALCTNKERDSLANARLSLMSVCRSRDLLVKN